MARVMLREIAHSRAGDKSNISNLSLIPYQTKHYGSVIQSPYDDAETSIDTLLKIINGEEVEFMTYQPNPPVTRELIDSGEVTRPDW